MLWAGLSYPIDGIVAIGPAMHILLPRKFCREPWFSIENQGTSMTTSRSRVTVSGTIAQVGPVGSTGSTGEVPLPRLAGVRSNGKRLTIQEPTAAVAIVSVD